MSRDLRLGSLGRSTIVVTALVLAAGCGPSANPSASPASAASIGASSSPSGASAHAVESTNASESPIDLAALTGRIVFDNSDDVWSINADGSGLTRLTQSPWPEFDATWSPDGTQIAFRSEPNGDQEIWLMNADGSEPRKLVRGLSPAWSPDGSKIAYASPGDVRCPPGRGPGCSGLSIMNADGSGQHRVPVPETDVGEYPSWSPDGKRIVFNSNLTGGHVMYVVDVDGSRVVDLSSVGEGWQVDWSPDGSSILFASGRDQDQPGYDDIYVMRPDGSGVRRLSNNNGYTPAWSPDGRYIVFSAPGLHVMRADGSGVTPLPIDVGETMLPDWR